jgi:O-acetyl-ADP-ribose deacetylase (regulator of RNase III)
MEITYCKGDLVALAQEAKFDVVTHSNNCFNNQGKGIAKRFNEVFGTCDPKVYRLEGDRFKGDINKLGQIEWRKHVVNIDQQTNRGTDVTVVNLYGQYRFGVREMNCDYDAIRLGLRKIGVLFKGKHIGLPRLGCGLGGGDWMVVERMIRQELKDCTVTVVDYERETRKA